MRRRSLRAQCDAALAGYCYCTRCQRRTGTASSAQARIDGRSFRLVKGAHLVKCWRRPDGGFEKCVWGDPEQLLGNVERVTTYREPGTLENV